VAVGYAFKNPILRAGCENFRSLNWDNDSHVSYEKVSCPRELDRLNCWKEDGDQYPLFGDVPEFCAWNLDGNGGETTMFQNATIKFTYNDSKMKNCKFISKKIDARCEKAGAGENCPVTCDAD